MIKILTYTLEVAVIGAFDPDRIVDLIEYDQGAEVRLLDLESEREEGFE